MKQFFARIDKEELVANVIAIAVGLIFMGILWYVAMPALSLRNEGLWGMIIATVFVVAFNVTIICFLEFTEFEWQRWAWLVLVFLIAILIILGCVSWMAFHARQAVQVADVTISDALVTEVFPDLAEGTTANLPLVDLDSAIMLGDKKVAGLENASWYEVEDDYTFIKYQGRYYRLAFLEYGDFWKYRKARAEGIPGYILVETNPSGEVVSQEATLVELETPILYSESAYFGHNLKRHLRAQFPGYIFGQSTAEIDETGKPYYVTEVLKPSGGVFAVKTVDRVIVTDAQTGVSEQFFPNEAPEWIDNVYSLEYLLKVAEWHYTYRNGYFNWSQTGVWHTAYKYRDARKSPEDGIYANFYGYSAVIVDGGVRYYTGLTAANAAESNLGWLILDPRTGKMAEYAVVGAEESSAQAAAEQLVSAYRYQATFPLPVNVSGEPTYLMCLKGTAGIVQAYALCNVSNYSIVAQAETLPEAICQYLARLGHTQVMPPVESAPTDEYVGAEVFFDGEVVNTYTIEVNGTTQIYFEMNDGSVYVVVKIK